MVVKDWRFWHDVLEIPSYLQALWLYKCDMKLTHTRVASLITVLDLLRGQKRSYFLGRSTSNHQYFTILAPISG